MGNNALKLTQYAVVVGSIIKISSIIYHQMGDINRTFTFSDSLIKGELGWSTKRI